MTQASEFWYKGAIEGYALEFVVDCHQSLTKELEYFKKGLCEIPIEEILGWIKLLMVERGMLLNFIEMET